MNPRSKDITITLIGHAHIDPVWLWDWREGYETVKATFRSALDRLQENQDMVFVHSSVAQYAWMENHPRLLQEIRDAVQRGQWEPVGGWWVEPDVNLPHGEALARQGVYGQRELERLVGRKAKVAFLPDSFGHPSTLPQLFEQSGLASFVFMRPSAGEIDLPSNLFRWKGSDGTEILSWHVECYNTNPKFIDSSLERNLHWRPEYLQEWAGLFGVGNHGGGPTRKAIESIRQLNNTEFWPTLKLGSLEGFMDRMGQVEHPTFDGELQHHARGCYAADSEIKRLNRKAEHALMTAEKLCSMAVQYGLTYPKAELTKAWKRLLFNQFHDILAGSSIESAYQDARIEMGEALAIASQWGFTAMQTIADQVDTRLRGTEVEEVIRSTRWDFSGWVTDYGDGVPVIVFNPSSHERSETIHVELNDWHTDDVHVMDEAGNSIYHQLTTPESASGGRPRILFHVTVPPMGYRMYRVIDRPGEVVPETAPMLNVTDTVLENQWWRLEFNPRTGTLQSLRDKTHDVELLAGAGAQYLIIDEPTDTWGHGIKSMRHLAGVLTCERLAVLERGPVRATMRAHLRYGNSTGHQDISIYRESPQIDGTGNIEWHEKHMALQLAFPLTLTDTTATYEVPYGSMVRPADGEEEPVQSWLDVSGTLRDHRGIQKKAGVALLNDSKYSASVLGGDIRLSVLRSPVYAHHDPAKLSPDIKYAYQDQGQQSFRWSLVPHAGDWKAAQVPQKAHALNVPLPFVREYVHGGDAPAQQSFLSVEASNVVVSAWKQAEDSTDAIVRLHETSGQDTETTLQFQGRTLPVKLRAHQVLGLKITPDGVSTVNFLEEDHA
ncbi:alpha-mannosidase [Deinococcus cellulosilyticus]|uniref:Glycoside hydrolase family 38 central domain-containing protein n=1 Tax=Deinococcus cellulosilyticus (strain DSM 18568 / NBRC 106333 / KACC 11606 / 5516J-15) TaxID=1223518 RepID=A0A511N4E5_DEIC1|nr:alpha-mannosidase [Deinococcus cellulosilyticus]GEM47251.1 hypothetical protein DC3_28860 [Deinococcus cellulosilyticus NBRC 106333 = KACC 11606]